MTRVVAVDTSTWWGGVALVASDEGPRRTRAVAEAGLLVRESHTAQLLQLLEGLLQAAGWSRDSIDAYAASRGPGSFTGIRVGLGTIRGLALAAGKPCLGITSLQALAEAFGSAETARMPMIDAGRDEIYAALYDAASSPPRQVRAPWVGPPEQAFDGLDTAVVAFGPGASRYADRLAPVAGRLAACPSSVAAAVGRLALLRIAEGAGDGDGLAPLYVRPADAKPPLR